MAWYDKFLNGTKETQSVNKSETSKQTKQKANEVQSGTIYDNIEYNQGAKSLDASEQEFLEASKNFNKYSDFDNTHSRPPQDVNTKPVMPSQNLRNTNSAGIKSAGITGNETISQLRSSLSDAQAQLSEAEAQKANNDAINEAQKQAYDEAVEQMKSDDEQVQAQIDDIKSRKSENDNAVSEQKTQISDINSDISDKKSQISGINSELGGLVQPSQSNYMTTDEEGNQIVDTSAYNAAMAQYQAQKSALEEQLSKAENELNDLETQLSDAETQLDDLEQQGSEIEQELSDLIQSEDGQKIQNQQLVQDAMQKYNDSQQNLTQTTQQQTVELDSNIAQLQSNIDEYNNAIQQKEAEEAQKTSQTMQDNTEEGALDPLTLQVGDEEYTLLDAGVNENTFDSTDDFLADKSLDEAIEDIPGNHDYVLSFEELEAAGINVIDSDGEIKGIGEIRSEIASELDIESSEVSNIGISINQDMIDKYNNQENQDLTIVDTSKKDEAGNFKEVDGIEATSTFEDADKLREQYNLPESSSIKSAKDAAHFLSKEVTEDTETLLSDARKLLHPEEYSQEEIKAAAEEINETAPKLKSENKEKEVNPNEFGAGKADDNTSATMEKLVKLSNALQKLDPDNAESKKEIKSLMLDTVKTFNIENGVSPVVANAISMAYGEIGVGEDYIAAEVQGGMEIPIYDEAGNLQPLDKSKGGIKANTGAMEKYGGKQGDAWCVKFLSWLYGAGQGVNFSDTFKYDNADIAVRAIRQEAADKNVYSPVSHEANEINNNYEPVPGDIMVLENNNASHVAMVINSDDEYIYTIEGNADNEVRAKKYSKTGEKYNDVSGYIRMNELYGSSATPINIDYLAKNLDENIAHSDTATQEEKEAFLLAKTHEGTI